MRILFLTNGYPTAKHPEYCVFTKEQIESLKKIGITGDIYFINARQFGKKEYFKAYKKLKGELHNYDLVHCFHGLTAILMFFLNYKGKILISFQSSINNEFAEGSFFSKGLLTLLLKYLLKKERIGKIFKGGVPKEFKNDCYSFYLPNGVDTQLFSPMDKNVAKKKLNLSTNKRYILFVSAKNLHRKEKRYDIYLKVIKILVEKYKMWDIQELTLVNETRERVPLYFNSADLHLLTSDFEGSPNSVKESLSCNTPVVATDVGNVKEMLGDVPNCFLVDGHDPETIAKFAFISLMNVEKNNLREFIFKKRLDSETKAIEIKRVYEFLMNN